LVKNWTAHTESEHGMGHEATNTAPQVSIIVPAYNAENTLAETLESVAAQTFEDWELIVVDDGSSDATTAIVALSAQSDPRIRLILQKNAGPSAARRNGVGAARSDVIAFLDSDDTWACEHLALAMALLEGDAGLGVAFAPCKIVDSEGHDTGQRTRPATANVTAAQILAGNPTATCSSLVVRRRVFVDAGHMRSDMVHAEDQEWLFRVVQSGWACRSHTCYTVNYRSSPQGLSSDVQRMYAGWQMFVQLARQTAPDVVRRHLAPAAATMHFYYARRLMRDNTYSMATLRHFGAAWVAAPLTAATLSLRLMASQIAGLTFRAP
jgi:glycosyltransferase involved in cell wall biosynthesis